MTKNHAQNEILSLSKTTYKYDCFTKLSKQLKEVDIFIHHMEESLSIRPSFFKKIGLKCQLKKQYDFLDKLYSRTCYSDDNFYYIELEKSGFYSERKSIVTEIDEYRKKLDELKTKLKKI